MEVVVVHFTATDTDLRRNLLLEAVTDEVDAAIAGLQTTRQLLVELRRVIELTEKSIRTGPGKAGLAADRPAPLRYSGVTVAEASRILDLSEEHVRRLLRRGELEGVAYGGRVGWRLSRAYVEELAEQQRRAREGQSTARRAKDRVPTKRGPSGGGRSPNRR